MDRKEAIEVVRKKVDYYEADKRFKAALEALIPELVESEYNKMLGKVLECITYVADHNLLYGGVSETRLKAWLLSNLVLPEKQKEQKPAENTPIYVDVAKKYFDSWIEKHRDSPTKWGCFCEGLLYSRKFQKPTEEQMSCLKTAIDYYVERTHDEIVGPHLNSLYEQLKKL